MEWMIFIWLVGGLWQCGVQFGARQAVEEHIKKGGEAPYKRSHPLFVYSLVFILWPFFIGVDK